MQPSGTADRRWRGSRSLKTRIKPTFSTMQSEPLSHGSAVTAFSASLRSVLNGLHRRPAPLSGGPRVATKLSFNNFLPVGPETNRPCSVGTRVPAAPRRKLSFSVLVVRKRKRPLFVILNEVKNLVLCSFLLEGRTRFFVAILLRMTKERTRPSLTTND